MARYGYGPYSTPRGNPALLVFAIIGFYLWAILVLPDILTVEKPMADNHAPKTQEVHDG